MSGTVAPRLRSTLLKRYVGLCRWREAATSILSRFRVEKPVYRFLVVARRIGLVTLSAPHVDGRADGLNEQHNIYPVPIPTSWLTAPPPSPTTGPLSSAAPPSESQHHGPKTRRQTPQVYRSHTSPVSSILLSRGGAAFSGTSRRLRMEAFPGLRGFCHRNLMALDIFIDESGYTGEHHLDPAQPVFVLSSICLTGEITSELLARHFAGVQARESNTPSCGGVPTGARESWNLSVA